MDFKKKKKKNLKKIAEPLKGMPTFLYTSVWGLTLHVGVAESTLLAPGVKSLLVDDPGSSPAARSWPCCWTEF